MQECFTKNLEARDLPTKTVIVYADRAEVKRILELDLQQGKNIVIVQNVSSVIERQSIRVEGRGNTVIQEVQYMELPTETVETNNQQVYFFVIKYSINKMILGLPNGRRKATN
jgi:hypothetical protein